MKGKSSKLSISAPSDRSKTLWSDFLIFRNSSSEVAVNRASGEFPAHLHEFAELSFVLSGSALHRVNGFERNLSAGDYALATPGDRHGYFDASRDFKRLNVQMRRKLFEELSATLAKERQLPAGILSGGYAKTASALAPAPLLPPDGYAECVKLALAMEREWLEASPGAASLLKFMAGELLLTLLRAAARSASPKPAEENLRLREALTLVASDYARDLRISELERVARMGRRSLERAFKAETGLAPKRYLLKTRLAWACRLLVSRGVRVQEAASACGFKDQNYFARAFKAAFGLSPAQFAAASRKSA